MVVVDPGAVLVSWWMNGDALRGDVAVVAVVAVVVVDLGTHRCHGG
jgi:hypothetical protein